MTLRSGFASWGRVFRPEQRIAAMADRTEALPLPADGTTLLPYGLGRSYGDSCLNDGQTLLRTRSIDRLIAFDASAGLIRCEAGVTLAELIEFALPRGFFLAVTPGTKHVTVGGAIANDVHGKNHHRDGTFAHHVTRFELLRSDGSRRECARDENAELFAATVGGLGLTGLITWAELRLRPVKGPWIRQRAMRFRSLEEFFNLCAPFEKEHAYVVAWLDGAGGRTRGVLFGGDHGESTRPLPARGTRRFPVEPPFSLVNPLTVGALNQVYFHVPRGDGAPRTIGYDPFFYPLDSVLDWNRAYGRGGFYQYQCVVPPDEAGRGALDRVLRRISESGQGSFLSVLKRFGEMPSLGLLSFPRPGYTLAMDFPNRGAPTLRLLDTLDDIVAAAGGRVYPAKDARMSPAAFKAFYPEWRTFSAHVDPRFSSSFWRRVTT